MTILTQHGATLHLSQEGTLTIRPPAVAQRYRTAIEQHLCGLLVTTAIQEVQRLIHSNDIALTGVKGMVSLAAMNAACLSGDVAETRRSVTQYVADWKAWLALPSA